MTTKVMARKGLLSLLIQKMEASKQKLTNNFRFSMLEDKENYSSQEWPDDLLPRSSESDTGQSVFKSEKNPNQSASAQSENLVSTQKGGKNILNIILVIIFILLIIGGLGFVGWFINNNYRSQIVSFLQRGKTEEQKKEEENNQIIENMVKKNDIAKKKVVEKYPDAYLISVIVGAKPEGINNFSDEIKAMEEKYLINLDNNYDFVFYSPKTKKHTDVLISINKNEDGIIRSFDENSLSQYSQFELEISIHDIKIGYKKLFDILNNNGGSTFINGSSNIQQMPPTLLNYKDKPSYWTVGYVNKDKKSIFYLEIDPNNGTIQNHATEALNENEQLVIDMKRKVNLAQNEIKNDYPDAYLTVVMPIIQTGGKQLYNLPFSIGDFQNHGIDLSQTYSFIFDSPSANQELIVFVKIDEDEVIKKINIPLSQPVRKPISLDKLEISYKTAIKISDEKGGHEFKKQNSNYMQMGPVLAVDNKYGQIWALIYYTEKPSVIYFVINAKTGVVGVQRGPLPSGSGITQKT